MSYFAGIPTTFTPAPFNPGTDPYVQEFEGLLSAQSQQERAERDQAIKRAVISFGAVPNFAAFGAQTPEIDATTLQLAQQNTAAGLSTQARLQKELDTAQRVIPRQQAAQGMLFSGTTGWQLGEAQQGFVRATSEASQSVLDYIQGAINAWSQAERGRGVQVSQGRQEARLRNEAQQRENFFRQQDLAIQRANAQMQIDLAQQQMAQELAIAQQQAAAAAGGGGGGGDGGGGGGPAPVTVTAAERAQILSFGTGVKRDAEAQRNPAFAEILNRWRVGGGAVSG